MYQTFFYAYAYARDADRARDQVCAYILYPATGGKGGTRLLVRQDSGATSARIIALPVDIDAALSAIAERRVASLPVAAEWFASRATA